MAIGIHKIKGRSIIKDVIVAVLCIAFFVALFYFILTPKGDELFSKLTKDFPFSQIISGTISDLDKLAGMVLSEAGLGIEAPKLKEAMTGITMQGIVLDLSKLLLSSLVQILLYMLFSVLFLYSRADVSIISALTGGDGEVGSKIDVLYFINSKLLLAISILTGTFCGNFLIGLVNKKMETIPKGYGFVLAIAIYALLVIVYSLFFMLRSKNKLGKFYSLTRSFVKTLSVNTIPALVTMFVIDMLLIVLYHSAKTFGFHIITVLAAIATVVWAILSKYLGDLLVAIFKLDLPFMGKYCPISGIMWLPATATMVALSYISTVPSYGGQDILVEALSNLPFMRAWVGGTSPLDCVLYSFDQYSMMLVDLFIICFVVSLLQYLSSSFFPTLFTQIIVRIFLFIGIGLTVIALLSAAMYYFESYLLLKFAYSYVALVISAFIFAVLMAFQPYLMLQSIFSTAAVILLFHFFPCSTYFLSNSYDSIGRYIACALIVVAINTVVSFAQNIIASIEKRANIVRAAANAAS